MENDDWLVVIPLDKDASCFHGKNSDWCTTKINQGNFEDYFYENNYKRKADDVFFKIADKIQELQKQLKENSSIAALNAACASRVR